MFDDNRSKRIVFVAHCLLNQNAISDGTADCPSQFAECIDLIMKNQVGLIQLPCPEMTCLGLDRGDPRGGERPLLLENTRIRAAMSEKVRLERLRGKAEEVAAQIQDYRSHGFAVLGLVGVNRSPSCGVETTSMNNSEVDGRGVFVDLIAEACHLTGQTIEMIGVKTSEPAESVRRLRRLIDGDALSRGSSPHRCLDDSSGSPCR